MCGFCDRYYSFPFALDIIGHTQRGVVHELFAVAQIGDEPCPSKVLRVIFINEGSKNALSICEKMEPFVRWCSDEIAVVVPE